MSEPQGRTPNPYDPMRFPPINGPVSPDSQAPPFWPPNPPPNGGRRLIWLLVGLVCALTAIVVALSVTVVGRDRHEIAQSPTTTSAPATSDRQAPLFPASALDSLLPDRSVVSSVVADPAIDLVDHGEAIAAGDLVDADCQGIASVFSRDYVGSGWTAIRWQRWNSPAEPNPSYLVQHVSLSVTTYPNAAAARAFYAKQSAAWRKCNTRIVNSRDVSAKGSPEQLWYIDSVADYEGVLAARMTDNVNSDWRCEARLTVRSNVVVHVGVCAHTTSMMEARTLLASIAQKVDAAG